MQQSKQDERTDKNVASGCFYRTCSAGFTEMPSIVHVVVTSLSLKLCQAWPLTSPCWLAVVTDNEHGHGYSISSEC